MGAAQTTEAAALIAVAAAQSAAQLCLVGDTRQLPPTVVSMEAQRCGMSRSLFERLAADTSRGVPIVLLRMQFRMHPSICKFPSAHFYGNQLLTSISDADQLSSAIPGFNWPCEGSCRVSFINTSPFEKDSQGFEEPKGHSWQNSSEVNEITEILGNILTAAKESGVPAPSVGIVSPYSAQRTLLQYTLDRKLGRPDFLTISTIDALQGSERDLILFSATRSNNRGTVGFLSDARRINVMLTRARHGLIVLGDCKTLQCDTTWRAWLDWWKSATN